MMKPIKVSFDQIINEIPFESLKAKTPRLIIGIERGGVILASLLAYRLELPLVSLKASLYDDSKPARAIYDEPKVSQLQMGVRGKRVLLVDDVSKSGKTLEAVKKQLLIDGAAEIITFVYAGKADFSCRPFDMCLVFPWERLEGQV